MQSSTYTPIREHHRMKSYIFKVVFERDKWPDEPEEKAIWRAYIPVLPAAHAWGNTQQEAFANLKNAVDLMKASLESAERLQQQQLSALRSALDQHLRSVNDLTEAKSMDDLVTLRNKHYGIRFASDVPIAAQWRRTVTWYDHTELMSFWSEPGVPLALANEPALAPPTPH